MTRARPVPSPSRLLPAAGALAAALGLAACGDSSPPGETPTTTTTAGDCEASDPTVAWKRTDAVLADLGRGLELTPEQVCLELGTAPCSAVHRVALGQSDPFDRALYKPFAEPLGTTPIAAERAVLHACVARVTLDASAADPVVFRQLDLTAPSAGEDLGAQSAFGQDAAEVGRRLLGRDLSDEEIGELAALAVDEGGAKVPASEVAKLVCFTIGTSREFLFF